MEPYGDVVGPRECPPTQFVDLLVAEAIGSEFAVVDPVRSTESCLEFGEVEGIPSMTLTERFEFRAAPTICCSICTRRIAKIRACRSGSTR